jgi:integrase
MSTAQAPLQYCLFPGNDDAAALREERDKLMTQAKAPNTLLAYAHCWKMFSAWCTDRCLVTLPCSPETLQDYLTWGSALRTSPYSRRTLLVTVCAITHYHRAAGLPLPVTPATRELLACIARKAARSGEREECAGKKHLTPALIRKICRAFDGAKLIDVRDHAILLTGYASGLRRSDLSRLRSTHLHFDEEPNRLRVWVPFSKTDQEGDGRNLWIDRGECEYTCPLRALAAWLKIRGLWRGPLFVTSDWNGRILTQRALGPGGINAVLKRALERIGENPEPYGAHSLRSGMITAACASGKNWRDVMDRSGHRSISTFMRYVKSGSSSSKNVLEGVL